MSESPDPNPNSSAFWMPVAALSRGRKKVRPDAVLKNLSPAAQSLIVTWCKKPVDRDTDGEPIKGTGGVEFALGQLAEVARDCSLPALDVSPDTLYKFLSWWKLEQDLDASSDLEAQVLQKTGDRKAAREAGEILLMRLGLARQDSDLILTAARVSDSRRALDLKEESGRTKAKLKLKDLELAERRVVVLEQKINDATKAVTDSTLSPEEKEKRIKAVFGIAG